MPQLEGPVLKMTVPFNQLANADVFARSHEIRSKLYGIGTWYVYCETEWPGEHPAYLAKSGIVFEEVEMTEADMVESLGDPSQWPIGLYESSLPCESHQ